MSFTYKLPKNSQAWQNAFAAIADHVDVSQAADALPVFAIVVVTPDKTADVDALMQAWADTQANWQAIVVHDDETAKANAYAICSDEKLADVAIHRYLLAPCQKTTMSEAKRTAAAHIIDEQITQHLGAQIAADVHILSLAQMLNTHRLACFDMDSTLIEEEVIVELARFCQVEDEVAAITERAMRGEIEFAQSFSERVALLKGAPISIVDEIIAKHIHIQSGAAATIKALKALGYHTVLISGGFEPFAEYVARTLGMDEYHANPLLVTGEVLAGQVSLPILDGDRKAAITAKIAQQRSLPLHEVVCIGDGANDLPMMAISDIGVAFKAKPIVQAKASAAVNLTGLEGVLYALGHRLDLAD